MAGVEIGGALAEGWEGVGENPHFSQRTREMGHPAKLWSYATGYPVLSSPAIANGVVYVGSGGLETSGKIYALNAKSGTKLWSYDPGTTVVSSPAVANGVVYVGSGFQNYPSKLYALNAQTGAKLWSYTARNAVDSSPAVVNGVVFIGSEDGNLYAFSLKKGRE